jgi:hypothetical protein
MSTPHETCSLPLSRADGKDAARAADVQAWMHRGATIESPAKIVVLVTKPFDAPQAPC